ncbi:uncharacterized protein LOC121408597 isoform X2 [Lytechinus variegatus]|uniref:uncharacterized protein LOC121408597 isoform X2 n=1 Tax=Lytechinus variegatus TaxID=7654 RepID=UPI001BB0ECF6|nr:uncharacterized protein LOC121408597 isoform X2 [Lytechinus variegatus]
MDEQRNKGYPTRVEKKGHHKLYNPPYEPLTPDMMTDPDGLTSVKLPGKKSDILSAKQVSRKKRSTKKQGRDEDDVWGSDQDIFVKPKVRRRQNSSSSGERAALSSRLIPLQSPIKRQKLRQSLSHISPRRSGSAQHSISMTKENAKKLQFVTNRARQRRKSIDSTEAPRKCRLDNLPPPNMEQKVLAQRAGVHKESEKLNEFRNKQHLYSDLGDSFIHKELNQEDKNSSQVLNFSMSGMHGCQSGKNFKSSDALHNPSEGLFTDTESGNETDTQAIIQRTVSRFLSSQEVQKLEHRSSCSEGVRNVDSEVSESSNDDDEANETFLEKEVRGFFESKKQPTSRDHRAVDLPSVMSLNPVQQGLIDGVSDESEVICAGQKMRSQREPDVVRDNDTHEHSSEPVMGDSEYGQRLSVDSSSSRNSGVAISDINLDQVDETLSEDIFSGNENSSDKMQNFLQRCESFTNQDVEIDSTSEESILQGATGKSSDVSERHQLPGEQAATVVSPPPSTAEIGKQMFRLYCHKTAAPEIFKVLKTCGSIDGSSLQSAAVDEPMCIEAIWGKVLEDSADRTLTDASPVLFEENSDDFHEPADIEEVEQLIKETDLGSDSRKRAAENSTKTNPKKLRKKKKKVPETQGDGTLQRGMKIITEAITGGARKINGVAENDTKTTPKKLKKKKKKEKMPETHRDNTPQDMEIVTGPIKGDARKKNELRWKEELGELTKCLWSPITLEPSLESGLCMLRRLKAAAKATPHQRKTQLDRTADLKEDDPNLGGFINLLSYPDVFMTRKKDRPTIRNLAPSEIQVLDGS